MKLFFAAFMTVLFGWLFLTSKPVSLFYIVACLGFLGWTVGLLAVWFITPDWGDDE